MHIGIDGNLLCGKKTGMGMVVYSVLRNWKTDTNKVTVFVSENLDKETTAFLEKKRINIFVGGRYNYFKWEQVVLPRLVKEERADILWCPYNTAPLKSPCPVVVTVHDLIYMSQKIKEVTTLYKKAGLIYRRLIVPRAISKAKKIITVSEYAKQEICNCFPNAEKKISVIYNGTDSDADELSKDETLNFFQKEQIRKPYILGFGSLEKRKNSMGLIKAYERLDEDIKQEYQLVLFGFRGYEESEEYKYIWERKLENVIILGYISEAEKTALYKNSTMFVFPTFSEGFGIPVLEAYASRTPVITSNTTSLPEVAGDAALLINPSDVDEICLAMKKVIKENVTERMVTEGERQLRKFDWTVTAQRVKEILETS